MLLRHLELQHFRNYATLDATFDGGMVLLQGANAQGKTNILEAIYLLATTKSSRARTDTELISWGGRDPLSAVRFARVVGRVERTGGTQTLEIVVREGSTEGQARKRFKLNGAERKAGEVLGRINAVFFAPTDVDLVAGSPSVRRRYLDVMLCQVDPGYFRALQGYNRAILQRNALLRQVRDRLQPPGSLEFWDTQLSDFGAQVMAARVVAVRDLGAWAATRHTQLSDGAEQMLLRYKAGLPEPPEDLAIGSPLAARTVLQQALITLRPREIAAGVSLVGPHRDDLAFAVNGIDATSFGSRGQQRTVALALKLAELEYMRAVAGESPILLLDDAASELDEHRRKAVLATALEGQQTFVTSADGAGLGNLSSAVQRWEVRAGTLRQLDRGGAQ